MPRFYRRAGDSPMLVGSAETPRREPAMRGMSLVRVQMHLLAFRSSTQGAGDMRPNETKSNAFHPCAAVSWNAPRPIHCSWGESVSHTNTEPDSRLYRPSAVGRQEALPATR